MSNPTLQKQQIVLGWGVLDQAPQLLSTLGRRPLLLTGKHSARQSGLSEFLRQGLTAAGCTTVCFEGIADEAETAAVDAAAALARRQECDIIVAVGGGAVMDAGKAVAVLARQGGQAWDLPSWGCRDEKPSTTITDVLPLACIPTVAASGSEANGTGVLYHRARGEKAVFFDQRLTPALAVVDPKLMVTVGPLQTHAGAMDILAHGIEDYLAQEWPDAATTARATNLAHRVAQAAQQAKKDPFDRVARTTLAQSAMDVWRDGYNGPETPWTLHAIAHVLGGRLHMGHSRLIAYLLPLWIDFLRVRDPYRLPSVMLDDRAIAYADLGSPHIQGCDVSSVTDEILALYGVNGILPGWPGLIHRDLYAFLCRVLMR